MEYNVARGTRDILFKENRRFMIVEEVIRSVAETYGGNTSDNGARLYIKFLAPKGVKGVASNCRGNNERYLSPFPWEHEYLLDKGQSGRIVDIDYDTGCVTVLLE